MNDRKMLEEIHMEGIMIKEAAKMLGVESHVLRYWEEELGLEIKRNSMGHRFYDQRDIKMFREIMDLKDRGFSLKDIKVGIEARKKEDMVRQASPQDCADDANQERGKIEEVVVKDKIIKETVGKEDFEQSKIVDFKTAQLQTVMNKIIANALRENKDIITSSIKSEITEDVMRQFDTVMREKEEKEEARFRKLDEALRQIQRANEEVAATKVKKRFGWRK
ncbi:MAG: MerR family transcriptional regulator [Lachnospiraceae bacterium]|nr:MerR family transcriptional regulator [Lachnospiraceae bacterium]